MNILLTERILETKFGIFREVLITMDSVNRSHS